ncbi:MAG: hypothetical protein M0P42_16790 [Gallionella sp.]|jgi:hypothetical protein|nr:hypothetical protein [Gallionella sp.]
MIVTELHVEEIPEIYRRFAIAIGDQHWKRRVIALKNEIRGNRFLASYLHDENSIAFTLDRFRELNEKYGAIPLQAAATHNTFPAVSFAAQVLSIIKNSNATHAEKLKRRIHGAFNKPEDLRALQLELTAATHFHRRGYKVSWPEMNESGALTVDLLIEDICPNGLEVECKAITPNKGRKVHRRDALEFHSLLNSHLTPVNRSLRNGLSVVLTIAGRLPSNHKQLTELAKSTVRQIMMNQSTTLPDGSDIRITEFPVEAIGDLQSIRAHGLDRKLIDKITATDNRESMVIGTRAGGRLIFTIQSSNNDHLLTSVFDTVSDSAKRQCSGKRPAMFVVGFTGIDSSELLSIAEQDNTLGENPTALRLAVSKFLSSSERDHVVGVGFLGKSSATPIQHGITDTGGTAYYFPKLESPFWDDRFSGLFS